MNDLRDHPPYSQTTAVRANAVRHDDGTVVVRERGMGGRTQATDSVASLRRAIARLEQKVSLLERVLTPEGSRTGASGERLHAGYAREVDRARREALDDYNYQEQLAMYRKTPGLLERMREVERKRNAFLEERGLPPEPTRIPKEILEEDERATRGSERQARRVEDRKRLAGSR